MQARCPVSETVERFALMNSYRRRSLQVDALGNDERRHVGCIRSGERAVDERLKIAVPRYRICAHDVRCIFVCIIDALLYNKPIFRWGEASRSNIFSA